MIRPVPYSTMGNRVKIIPILCSTSEIVLHENLSLQRCYGMYMQPKTNSEIFQKGNTSQMTDQLTKASINRI